MDSGFALPSEFASFGETWHPTSTGDPQIDGQRINMIHKLDHKTCMTVVLLLRQPKIMSHPWPLHNQFRIKGVHSLGIVTHASIGRQATLDKKCSGNGSIPCCGNDWAITRPTLSPVGYSFVWWSPRFRQLPCLQPFAWAAACCVVQT